jgi:hypothetical protein
MGKSPGQSRRWISNAGYADVGLLLALHYAFWYRAEALHGYWGHFNEASRWFQIIDLASLLVCLCCLFGSGWKRWFGTVSGLLSLLLSFGYAMGL